MPSVLFAGGPSQSSETGRYLVESVLVTLFVLVGMRFVVVYVLEFS